LVRRVSTGSLAAGRHSLSWDGRDGRGQPVRNGVYFARVTAGGTVRTAKTVVAR